MRRGFALLTVLATSTAAFFALNCSSESEPTATSTTPDGAVADTTAPSDDESPPGIDASTSDSGGDCPAGYDDFIPAAAGCETKNPLGIDKNALGLWLTGDRGLTCANGKVTAWIDQSGHARNAMPIAGHRAPECTALAAGGASVPHFAADSVDADVPVDAGRWDDDTLSVDLSFLANTAYTIIAVDRRHAPSKDYAFFLGTGVPSFDDYGAANTDRGLHVGYRFEQLFWFDQFNNPTSTSVHAIDAGDGGGPGPLHYTMARNPGTGDAGNLHVLRSDWAGAIAGDGGTATVMPAAADGRLGRGFGNTNLDTRFRGDLAEIIVYTKMLGDAELSEIKAYLERHWGLYRGL